MTQAQLDLTPALQMTWHRHSRNGGCSRDPAAGPGTCWHWWEGCPKATERGCYQQWARAHHAAGNVPDGPGKAKRGTP